MAETLLIVDNNHLARKVLESAFVQAGYRVVTATTGLEAIDRANQDSPDLVLLDIAIPQLDGIEVCYRLRQNPRTSNQTLVILTARDTLDDKLAAFRAGADEYLIKPLDTRELIARVGALLARVRRIKVETPRKEISRLVSFFSAKGGVGTTSVCVNTAAALAKVDPGTIVVADMVLPLGSVSYLTGVHAEATLAQMCRQDAKELTQGRMGDYIFSRDSLGFSIMVGAWSPKEAREVSPVHVEPVLKLLKEMARYTLADVGRNLSRISLPVITASDRVVVVLSPDTATLRMTKICLGFLEELQVPRQRLVLVLSLPVGREGMSKGQAEEYLQSEIFGVIPYEGDKFTVAANLGVPLVQKEPNCTAAQQFMELARHLADTR